MQEIIILINNWNNHVCLYLRHYTEKAWIYCIILCNFICTKIIGHAKLHFQKVFLRTSCTKDYCYKGRLQRKGTNDRKNMKFNLNRSPPAKVKLRLRRLRSACFFLKLFALSNELNFNISLNFVADIFLLVCLPQNEA